MQGQLRLAAVPPTHQKSSFWAKNAESADSTQQPLPTSSSRHIQVADRRPLAELRRKLAHSDAQSLPGGVDGGGICEAACM